MQIPEALRDSAREAGLNLTATFREAIENKIAERAGTATPIETRHVVSPKSFPVDKND